MELQTIDVRNLKTLCDAGVPMQLVDVREPVEFHIGHVHGAINMPLSSFDPSLLSAVPPLYLMCGSGGRSEVATKQLALRGVEAVNVEGGIAAWAEAGYEVVT